VTVLRKYLLAGVVALMPLLVVAALINWLIDLSDKAVVLLPQAYRPEVLFGMDIPGMGIVFALLLIIVIGALTTHFIGRQLMRIVHRVMERIPLVRTVYKATRQLLEAIFSDNSTAFKEVVLVPFPNRGSRVLGFVTGDAPVGADAGACVSVFVPSTPLPTTGWLLFVEADELERLDISVEEGMKLVLSGGVVAARGRESE